MADKQLFRVFVRILVQYLEISNLDHVRLRVMQAIRECREEYLLHQRRNNNNNNKQLCLTAMLHDRLRFVVPPTIWEHTEVYMNQYLLSRKMRRMGTIAAHQNCAEV